MRGIRRPRRAFGILAVLLVLVAGIHLLQGPAEDMGVGDAVHALFQGLGLASGASQTHVDIMVVVRLPRLLLAVTAGASLSLAGAVMQAVFRNPLASPEVIGTSSGAALGGVLAIVFGLNTLSPHAMPIVSFGVAAAVTFSVFLFAGSGSRFSVTSLLLAGIAVNTLVGSLISFVTTFSFRNFSESQGVMFWLMGGLDGADYSKILTTAVGLMVCGGLLLPFVRDLDLLTLEDDSARSLGVDVARVRQGLLLLACGLTAVTVANTGGITFVGLVVPHLTRLLVGPGHRALLPCAAVTGALVLLLADLVCRLAPMGSNLRIGVVTSLLGAPFFLFLLARHRRGLSL